MSESTHYDNAALPAGLDQRGHQTDSTATTGVTFSIRTTTIKAGTFTLYGMRK